MTRPDYLRDGSLIISAETSCDEGYCREYDCDYPNCAKEQFKCKSINQAKKKSIALQKNGFTVHTVARL